MLYFVLHKDCSTLLIRNPFSFTVLHRTETSSVNVSGQITSEQSLFTYKSGESSDTFRNDSYVPMFPDSIQWANDSLRLQAEATCGADASCLFDAAATNDLSVGEATKGLNIELVEEANQLGNVVVNMIMYLKIVYCHTTLITLTLFKLGLYSRIEHDNCITAVLMLWPRGISLNKTS